MKQTLSYVLLLMGSLFTTFSYAQDTPSQCVAAFVGNRMVVDEYSTKGQCRLNGEATGDLAVYTVDLSPSESKALEKIDFKVAIRDKATGTMTMYSNDTYRQVLVQQVLANCKKGDRIVLLTVGKRYALPHNEILVQ